MIRIETFDLEYRKYTVVKVWRFRFGGYHKAIAVQIWMV